MKISYLYLKHSQETATPKFVLPYTSNGFPYAIECIQRVKTKYEITQDDTIICQTEFLHVARSISFKEHETFVQKLVEFLMEHWERVSIEYLVVLVEKAAAVLIKMSNDLEMTKTFLPAHYKKHVEDIPRLNKSKEGRKDFFSKENVIKTLFSLSEKLWSKVSAQLNFNRKRMQSDEGRQIKDAEKQRNFDSALFQKLFDIWMAIFLNIDASLLALKEVRARLSTSLKGPIDFVKAFRIPYSICSANRSLQALE